VKGRCAGLVFVVGAVLTGVAASAADHGHSVAHADGDQQEANRRIRDLVHAANAGQPTAILAFNAAGLGMAALWSAADLMDLDREEHRAPFLLLAEHAAVSRRYHRELLRLYDPPAYRAFYTPAGTNLQTIVGRALRWKDPPRNMPEAVVMAAPESALAWLTAQSKGKPTNPELLLDILEAWGTTIGIGRERQYIPQLRALAAQLVANEDIRTDDTLLPGVLRFARPLSGSEAVESLASLAAHPADNIRIAAVAALGLVGDESALRALLAWVESERTPSVQAKIAEALGRWPDHPEAGAACLKLFERATESTVRRSVLYAAASSKWPQRNGLIHQALKMKDSMLLGAALAAEPVPDIEQELMRLLGTWDGKTPEPALIDALAASRVQAAVPVLVEALDRESNIAIRLKLIFALEKIKGTTAEQALLETLEETDDELEAEHLVSVIGRLKLSAAIPHLGRLARNEAVPMNVRVMAIWGLGCMPDESASAEIERIDAAFAELFAVTEADRADWDKAFHLSVAKPHLLLARYRMGSAAAGEEINSMFANDGPVVQSVLLLGILEQKADHPIIEKGLKSNEFFVLCAALAAARESNPGKYRPRIRELAASPFIQAAASVRGETWNLHKLLESP